MKENVSKPYGDIYFEKNLPKNCGECPFQYDGISCKALKYDDSPKELERCLNSVYGTVYKNAIFDRRYSKCPLKPTQSLKQQVREEVVDEIRERLKKANFEIMSPIDLYSYTDNFLYQVEKGENNEI